MSYADTPEQSEIRATVRALLARIDPVSHIRAANGQHDVGFDRTSWDRLTEELGVAALLVPEGAGGLGFTFEDACVVLEEAGRAAYNGPILESAVIAPLVIATADQDVSADWERLAAGAAIAAVAGLADYIARRESTVTASPSADGWVLDGRAWAVPFGTIADVVYVVARSEAGVGVWAVEHDAPGHDRELLAALDLSRPQSVHRFAGTPSRLIHTPTPESPALRLVSAQATVALTAEQIGIMAHLLETTIEYVRTRYQFGRAIGSFQAIKHRCVNMAIAAEGATAASWAARTAATAAIGGDETAVDEAVRLAAVASAYCSDAAVEIAGGALQLHGGIGMSWEHDIHLYLRRAKTSQHLLGAPSDHRRTLRIALDLASV